MRLNLRRPFGSVLASALYACAAGKAVGVAFGLWQVCAASIDHGSVPPWADWTFIVLGLATGVVLVGLTALLAAVARSLDSEAAARRTFPRFQTLIWVVTVILAANWTSGLLWAALHGSPAFWSSLPTALGGIPLLALLFVLSGLLARSNAPGGLSTPRRTLVALLLTYPIVAAARAFQIASFFARERARMGAASPLMERLVFNSAIGVVGEGLAAASFVLIALAARSFWSGEKNLETRLGKAELFILLNAAAAAAGWIGRISTALAKPVFGWPERILAAAGLLAGLYHFLPLAAVSLMICVLMREQSASWS